jgi:hypothetical protein
MKKNAQIPCDQKNLLYLEATIGRYKVLSLSGFFSFHLVFWGYWEATVLPLFLYLYYTDLQIWARSQEQGKLSKNGQISLAIA